MFEDKAMVPGTGVVFAIVWDLEEDDVPSSGAESSALGTVEIPSWGGEGMISRARRRSGRYWFSKKRTEPIEGHLGIAAASHLLMPLSTPKLLFLGAGPSLLTL